MKYPAHTVTQPLSDKQAQLVEDAVRTGKPIVNEQYAAIIKEIISENYSDRNQTTNGGNSEIHKS
jgi:hypothetical protein